MKYLLPFFFALSHLTAHACVIAPNTMWDSNWELVQSSRHIALAKVVGFEQKEKGWVHGEFQFKTTKVLKGKPPSTFTLDGFSYGEIEEAPADFDKHHDPRFWAYNAGNSVLPGDCSAYGIFYKGGEYLIVFREASHPRAF